MNLGVSRPCSARSAKNTGEHGEPAGTWSESEAGVKSRRSAESNPANASAVSGAAVVLGGIVPGLTEDSGVKVGLTLFSTSQPRTGTLAVHNATLIYWK